MKPIEIDGPGHPYAFTGLPILRRPDFGHHPCTTCQRHGAWNEIFYLDSGRCRLKDCGDCDGMGWRTRDGHHVVLDIVMVDGHPKWIVKDLPLPALVEPSHTAAILPVDPVPAPIPTADPAAAPALAEAIA